MRKKPPKKILAVKLADLGDALMITPALAALRQTFPTAQIDVLTTNGKPVLENLPDLDNIIIFDKYLFDEPRIALKPQNLLTALKFFGKLFSTRYDTVIFFHHFTLRFGVIKFAALAYATGAKVRAGLDNGRAGFLNHTIPDRGFGTLSEREYWLELVKSLGATMPENPKPRLTIGEDGYSNAQKLYKALESDLIIALHPGSGSYSLARRWLPVYFAEVADYLVSEYGAKIALLGGADELDLSNQVKSLMQNSEAAFVLNGKTNVKTAAAFLQSCRLFIGNDGGLMQLAGTVGTPVVAIFGPTNHRAWATYTWQTPEEYAQNPQSNFIVLQAPLDLPCRPCLYREMELGKRLGCAPRPCLTELKPAQVIEAAQLLLAKSAIAVSGKAVGS
jgi:lipopolysaccharide heptosyltransferase II